jgi:hypothetical protein
MKQLIKSQRLVSSSDMRKKNARSDVFKIHSFLRRASLVGFLTMMFFGFTYAQVGERGDITKHLRSSYQNPINEVDKIPVMTQNEFAEDFSNVTNVTWKAEDGYNEVDFTMNNKSMMAFFNYDDELLGEGYYVDYADLPEKGRVKIAKDYPDYIPEKAMFYHDDLNDNNDFLNFFGNFLPEEAYFVLLRKDMKEIVVQVTEGGDVSYFSRVRE